jgi:hypothetical protein
VQTAGRTDVLRDFKDPPQDVLRDFKDRPQDYGRAWNVAYFGGNVFSFHIPRKLNVAVPIARNVITTLNFVSMPAFTKILTVTVMELVYTCFIVIIIRPCSSCPCLAVKDPR